MTTAAIFFNDWPTAAPREIASFCQTLLDAGIGLDLEAGYGAKLVEAIPLHPSTKISFFTDIPEGANVAISLGGDGTLLRTARRLGGCGIPLAGVNAGHLGFLTQYTLDEAPVLARHLCRREFTVEQRMLLALQMEGMPEKLWPYAANDIAILKEDSASMLEIDAYADGQYVADYMADGLLAATPGGSTAYALAAGGPIVTPGVNTVLLVPVAPHTLTLRPMVIGGDTSLNLEARSRTGRCRVSVDGCSFPVSTPCRLSIGRAPYTMPLLCRPDYSYYATLRQKLHWAQR